MRARRAAIAEVSKRASPSADPAATARKTGFAK
jgi:hypothetical protein